MVLLQVVHRCHHQRIPARVEPDVRVDLEVVVLLRPQGLRHATCPAAATALVRVYSDVADLLAERQRLRVEELFLVCLFNNSKRQCIFVPRIVVSILKCPAQKRITIRRYAYQYFSHPSFSASALLSVLNPSAVSGGS